MFNSALDLIQLPISVGSDVLIFLLYVKLFKCFSYILLPLVVYCQSFEALMHIASTKTS